MRQHEAARPHPWQPDLPEDFIAARLREVVAFRLDISRVEGKFKLSQNRPAADRENATAAFESSSDQALGDLGRAMRALPGLPD